MSSIRRTIARPGGPIAAAWAALQGMGRDGYRDRARVAWQVAQDLREGIGRIPGLRVMGLPHSTIVTYTSTDPAVDVYAVADQLQAANWSVDRQQYPPSIHCTCNAVNQPMVGEYLADVRAAVDHVRAHPELARAGDAAMYGLMSRIPVRGPVESAVLDVLEGLYGPFASGALDLAARELPRHQRVALRAVDAIHRIRGRSRP